VKSIGTLFGRPIGQYWEDLELWETVLNEFPPFHFEWIVEFGTGQGGMSFYLYSQAWARQMRFYTVDIKTPDDFVPCFNCQDLRDGLPAYWNFMQTKPGILFCDNGNKPSEVYNYHSSLHRKCLLAVHDWGTEFGPSDIPPELRAYRSSATTIFLGKNDYLNELEIERLP
jgi:hypothetical protein